MPRKRNHEIDDSDPVLKSFLQDFEERRDYRIFLRGLQISTNKIRDIHKHRKTNGIVDICTQRGHEWLVYPAAMKEWIALNL